MDNQLKTLAPPTAPLLPYAPVQYDRTYHDTLNNILRQYFNTISTFASNFALSGVYEVAKLPGADVLGVGARAFVIDSSVSTFGTTVAGGGSTKVPVYSDGTNWKVG